MICPPVMKITFFSLFFYEHITFLRFAISLCLFVSLFNVLLKFSRFRIFLNFSQDGIMPMIPLGLKETKEIDFMEPFSDFILEHYSEEPSIYLDAIADITDTRQVSAHIYYDI